MEYLAILLLLGASTVALRRVFGIDVFRSRSHLFACLATFLVVGVAWDSFAVWRGHWSFGEAYLLGVRVGLLPVEEYLFIIVVPLWVIVVYRVLGALAER